MQSALLLGGAQEGLSFKANVKEESNVAIRVCNYVRTIYLCIFPHTPHIILIGKVTAANSTQSSMIHVFDRRDPSPVNKDSRGPLWQHIIGVLLPGSVLCLKGTDRSII